MSSSVRAKSAAEKALYYLGKTSRVSALSINDNPGSRTKGRVVRSKDNKAGGSHKELERAAKPPLGWIWGDWFMPWQRRFPTEQFYNKDIHLRREYPPLSLLELQRMIDLGWINPEDPIDLTLLCNTGLFKCNPVHLQFGVQLTDQGADIFAAKVNLEVQWASEAAIAGVERNGGRITTAYYDPVSLIPAVNPLKFFRKGEPIPRRSFPPMDIMDYYTDPRTRGYLANPSKVEDSRLELSQKYGYHLPEGDWHSVIRKDPLQIFHGLEPGWIVNLKDRTIVKPRDPLLQEYYNTDWMSLPKDEELFKEQVSLESSKTSESN